MRCITEVNWKCLEAFSTQLPKKTAEYNTQGSQENMTRCFGRVQCMEDSGTAKQALHCSGFLMKENKRNYILLFH